MESTVMMAKMFEALTWLKANLKNVILGAVVVIVVGGSITLFIYNRSQREVRASQALSEVATPATSVGAPLPGQAEAYLKVAQEYPGTKAAAQAIIDAAGVYYVEGKYADAEKAFQRELRDFPEGAWRSQANMGIAACLEQQGKTNEAIAKYEEVRRNPNAPEADDAKLRVATLYEAQGKRIEALKLYDELLKTYPYGGLGMEAGIKLEDLTNRYPALATNLTPVMPPTMPPTLMTTNRPVMTNITPEMMSNMMRMRKTTTNFLMMTNAINPPAAAPKGPTPVPNTAPKAPAGTNVTK